MVCQGQEIKLILRVSITYLYKEYVCKFNMDSIISVDNQTDRLGTIVDRVFTITTYEPRTNVKSESEYLQERENLQNQINKLQDKIDEINNILKN